MRVPCCGTSGGKDGPPVADVAVVIAAFNASATLDAALASVAAQTSGPAEVVVVDDGSADATNEVAKRWRSVLPLRVERQSVNRGPGLARSRGVAVTTAPLVALLDSDDLWLPNHLETLAAAHRRSGGIITADGYRWQPDSAGIRARSYRYYHRVPAPNAQTRAILRRNFVFIGAVFSRADYLDVGGFRDGFSGAEDWDLWIRMLRRGSRVHAVNVPTVIYRLNANGLTLRGIGPASAERVLRAALVEASNDSEREAAAETLRWLRARNHLRAGYDAARDGRVELAAMKRARQSVESCGWIWRLSP